MLVVVLLELDISSSYMEYNYRVSSLSFNLSIK